MTAKPLKLLIVAAWEPELTRLREHLAASAVPAAALEVSLATIGVGVVEAALGTAQALAAHRPHVALLLGTAGALPKPDAVMVGDVVTARRVRLVEGSLLEGAAELPPPMPAHAAFDERVHAQVLAAGAKSVQIANTVGITVSDALAARIVQAAAGDVEHLEAFAFARACAAGGVPCGVALGIANGVGSAGRGEWLANHVAASARAADVAWAAVPGLLGR
ncbi:MAG: 5-methylthioadenosine nucleosidase [Labilithrix sp.]|nr:5-methylthioadenosine nucleosidase [Labilithrix sp.]